MADTKEDRIPLNELSRISKSSEAERGCRSLGWGGVGWVPGHAGVGANGQNSSSVDHRIVLKLSCGSS